MNNDSLVTLQGEGYVPEDIEAYPEIFNETNDWKYLNSNCMYHALQFYMHQHYITVHASKQLTGMTLKRYVLSTNCTHYSVLTTVVNITLPSLTSLDMGMGKAAV